MITSSDMNKGRRKASDAAVCSSTFAGFDPGDLQILARRTAGDPTLARHTIQLWGQQRTLIILI
jgi:hypothetical protein